MRQPQERETMSTTQKVLQAVTPTVLVITGIAAVGWLEGLFA